MGDTYDTDEFSATEELTVGNILIVKMEILSRLDGLSDSQRAQIKQEEAVLKASLGFSDAVGDSPINKDDCQEICARVEEELAVEYGREIEVKYVSIEKYGDGDVTLVEFSYGDYPLFLEIKEFTEHNIKMEIARLLSGLNLKQKKGTIPWTSSYVNSRDI